MCFYGFKVGYLIDGVLCWIIGGFCFVLCGVF